ncbi:MAG: hypothetical protein B6D68_02350, partial [spirochete symbiont of Stewartia floridana]
MFLGRSLEEAEQAGAELIIIEIDTLGGRVDTALEITGKIGSAAWAKTVAYIPSDSSGRGVSWSAGALIAFSCSELWMAPGTSLGAAAPVYQTAEGTQVADEKVVSAVRGQMAALAEKNGYPINIALAMVDADIVLSEVEVGGEIVLSTEEEIEAMKNKGIAMELGKTVSKAGKLLTLTAGEMAKYGVSKGLVSTRENLITSYGYSMDDVRVRTKTRSDSIITLLTSRIVTSLLLIVGLVALYLEITSPGFGIPGTIALMCFIVVFGAGGLMGRLGSLELLMFFAGFALLLLEIFIIPGFGIAGILGFLLITASFVFSLQDFYWPEFDWQWAVARRNLGVVGIGVIGSIFTIGFIMATVPRASVFSRLILQDSKSPGYAGSSRQVDEKEETGLSDMKDTVTAEAKGNFAWSC